MGNKARWGFCNNIPSQGCQTSDGNDADAAIGIGLKGQSTAKEMGAGWTEYFNSNSPNKNSRRSILDAENSLMFFAVNRVMFFFCLYLRVHNIFLLSRFSETSITYFILSGKFHK